MDPLLEQARRSSYGNREVLTAEQTTLRDTAARFRKVLAALADTINSNDSSLSAEKGLQTFLYHENLSQQSKQQQNPDSPIAIHHSPADSQHACADASSSVDPWLGELAQPAQAGRPRSTGASSLHSSGVSGGNDGADVAAARGASPRILSRAHLR
eukprot:SAG25_NODE_37_length_19691_cov_19.319467_20_plen_156_part_00